MRMTPSLTPASLVMVLSLLVTLVSASFWGYEYGCCDLDPKHWEPELCQTGKNQSPISKDPSRNKTYIILIFSFRYQVQENCEERCATPSIQKL